ncbi:MAG TPA: serine hydrolase domain-containing protein [Gemmatimonadaceae bacterium]|nr:serine hydrolase domain-containing protein [Gemmatimonadaceae bacterium]
MRAARNLPLRAHRFRAAIATVLFVASNADAQPPHAALQAKLQAKLDSLHSLGRFPGATFAAALPNGDVIAIATGMSDTALKLRMKPTDLMPSGSTGKTYVSALAMQLVHEGKLDLNAPISKYLGTEPWFSRLPNSADITVRQLMTHTSGLVRYEFNERFTADLTKAPADKVWNPRDLIAYIFDTQAPFKAGEGWDYSDTNYMVLGIILEKITGATMNGEIQRRVVGPLKLTQTVPNASARVPGIVQGYAGANNPFGGTDAMLTNGAFAFNPAFEWAGGGWSSTTADLVRWAKALYEWKVFDASLSSRFLDGAAARLGQGARYGLGVIMMPASPIAPALGESIGHSGFFPGYQTEMRYYPAHNIAVALQINTSVGRAIPRGMAGATSELAAIILEGKE